MKKARHALRNCLYAGLLLSMALSLTGAAQAATAPLLELPGPADAGRVPQREELLQTPQPELLPPSGPMELFPNAHAPDKSKGVTMVLRDVQITGMTVFTTKDIKDIYASFLGHEITLDSVWMMAGQLSERYRNAGYFLSRVVVPQQEIKDGVVILRVVEGYIGEVKLSDEDLAQNRIIKEWLDRLQSYRPLKADQIESVLLHINDLPGIDLRAVLEPMENTEANEGAVRLVLEPRPTSFINGSISFDNNGSRFLGPYEAQLQAQAVFLPTQRTTFTGLSTLPWDELKYGGVKHEIPLFAGATGELYGSYTDAVPGYTLKPEDIKSASTTLGAAFDYSLIRQRQENLNARIAFETQDTESDILDTPLTRDYIRALRLGLSYQRADSWNGENGLNGTLSQGLNILGASQAGQLNLSRAGATPGFTKLNIDASRLQTITDDWGLLTSLAAQIASGPLYSSEQFGYGGQAFGRAYDNSEITGDRGINGSTELRYNGMNARYNLKPQPYGFYDIGAVSNFQDQTMPYASGSSAGVGFRLMSDFGFSSNVGMAFPLTRPIANPIDGNGKSPRYFFQLSYGF